MEFSLAEMVMIAFFALLLYGGRLPKVAIAVGRAIGELKRGLRETSDMVRYEVEAAQVSRDDLGLDEASLSRLGSYQDDPVDDEPIDPALATEDISLPADEPEPEAPAAAEAEDEDPPPAS